MWSAARELLACSWNPACFADVYRYLRRLKGQHKRVFWMCFAALCWSLWTTRNKFTIEGFFPNQPSHVLYKMASYLQVWRPVAKRKDRAALGAAADKIRTLLGALRAGQFLSETCFMFLVVFPELMLYAAGVALLS
jgi:hypothetical protein